MAALFEQCLYKHLLLAIPASRVGALLRLNISKRGDASGVTDGQRSHSACHTSRDMDLTPRRLRARSSDAPRQLETLPSAHCVML